MPVSRWCPTSTLKESRWDGDVTKLELTRQGVLLEVNAMIGPCPSGSADFGGIAALFKSRRARGGFGDGKIPPRSAART